MRLAEVAKIWRQAGVSVVPIVTKNQPAVRWKPYQARVPELDEVNEWWGNGHPYGIALICGAVSGGLEMTELEARALDSDALTKIANAADSLDCGHVWDKLSTGYTQSSPSGGLHLVYRISDHEVPGNEKIALDSEGLVRAETRGEGGYFVGAGSPGSCHPSGEPWLLASGAYGVVPVITWAERQLLHQALRIALDARPSGPVPLVPSTDVATLPEPVPARSASPGSAPGAGSISPGDDWSSRTDWADILEPNGWRLHSHAAGGERMWVRPGKDRRDGHSASTDFQGKPGFYVWSTSAGLETETPLTKLFIYAHYSFNGDMSACAQDLKRRGFGSTVQNLTMGELDLVNSTTVEPEEEPPRFSLDDAGNAMRLWHQIGRSQYRYVFEEKGLYRWSGVQWELEHTGHLEREWLKITESMEKQGLVEENKLLVKWARLSRSQARINAAATLMRIMEGATISASDMNTAPEHLNLNSGTYNTRTQQQEPHNRDQMMTRTMNASYDPQATCPKFDLFMEQVLPDPEVRRYVQRAVGYSLLGKADHRAFFLIYGPSGTGKSQFLSTMEYVFGGYAATAAEGTFRIREGGGPNNDLHGLRGKRFVSTSETAENANFNEQLLKRLTGRDQIVSREMYQTNITWTPECALWLATNHPPRFNSDDDAIWKRAKLVPFLTRFGTDMPEIPDFARAHLYAEADGILNWILAGLHDFLANGLGEPDAVVEAATKHRQQSDTVVQFLEDQLVDGKLQEVPEARIRTSELFSMYEDWCRSSGERGLGSRRFMMRLESSGRATYVRSNGYSLWKGLHRAGVLGSWETYQGKT
jgi:putative DNA primase/helicase